MFFTEVNDYETSSILYGNGQWLMMTAGIDVGSLTAKAVVIKDGKIPASYIMKTGPSPSESAETVLKRCLEANGIEESSIDFCCGTGYGRFEIPFADLNMSEISCHGMGAFWSNNRIRTIIDIGGQDCKVVSINENGMVTDFIMNDKCAAGTGRSLEILSRTLGIPLEKLGDAAEKSRRPAGITNKCSIFMELEIMEMICRGKKTADIASGLADAVAKRIVSLAGSMVLKEGFCITGGVAKNRAVVQHIERRLNTSFMPLSIDPQLAGAVGAAVFAAQACEEKAGRTA